MYHNCPRMFTILKGFENLGLSALSKKRNLIWPLKVSHCFLGTTMPLLNKKVAVVLSGCGVYDGSEIHEASACFAALSRHGATPITYSLDKEQHHVIAHNAGQGLYTYLVNYEVFWGIFYSSMGRQSGFYINPLS